jgi:NAD+ synthase
MSYGDLEKAMLDSKDKNYDKYLKIRKRNLHKMNLIPICKFDDNE